jgi:hypothetical protein
MDTEKMPKNADNFYCEKCNFKCSKLSNYNKHILTAKHNERYKKDKNDTEKMPKNAEKIYTCEKCGSLYKFHSGLWRHKKVCLNNTHKNITVIDNSNTELKMLTNIILEVVKSNADIIKSNNELQKQVLEISKDKSITQINNNTNSHNKTFNLNIFLNETCKDAMNITDFVESVKIKLCDLENVGTLGYVNGITNIIVKNLKELDICKRPFHCSDVKREILYVKDQNKWEKEDVEKERLKTAIKHIAHKNIQMIPEWKRENPNYSLDEGKTNDKYLKIVMQSMGGTDKNEDTLFQDKIISKLAKEAIINK